MQTKTSKDRKNRGVLVRSEKEGREMFVGENDSSLVGLGMT
jgi:hypothetical protein